MNPQGFDFAQAQVDPWASLVIGEHFYVIVGRMKDGSSFQSLVKSDQGEAVAIQVVLESCSVGILKQIKDIRIIRFDQMMEFDRDQAIASSLKDLAF